MKSNDLKELIKLMNSNKNKKYLLRQRIGENVEYVRVWDESFNFEEEIIANYSPDNVYFIKNESEYYCGLVYDMGHDLHWYLLEDHRNKGYMYNALRDIILPHIFVNSKERIVITILYNYMPRVDYVRSRKLARKLGFKQSDTNKEEFILDKSNFILTNSKLEIELNGLEKEKIEELRRKIFFAYKILFQVSDELILSYGYDFNLNKYIESLFDFLADLKDLSI